MTPIEKNIIVVDEQGREYEATYPKRAKGLVKNGRARFIDENKICLACPTEDLNFETEDIKMSENVENIEKVEKVENIEEVKVNTSVPTYTVEYILSQIAEIQRQTAYLNEAINKLADIEPADIGWAGDIGGEGNDINITLPPDTSVTAKAQALTDIVRCRETTNQQMLRIYEKMFDNLTLSKQNASLEADKWSTICRLADVACNDDDFASERAEMLDSIRQILRENK